ncbi:LacI family DNA-binding transcriptional regulator [Leucobacter weissii]|uniref:LacI family DNA-binding transcriptional regulator n=1 Tax=Leucobacter weissii TaxID=1983706 RepID=A0A939MIU6_9MICO|nr:LacI family DNA-binding transcriptional regulator [Leucobacter weissii]MBO1901040.1 LacI family DNA-binding transcriptional regulator [Leucobacter weissii]
MAASVRDVAREAGVSVGTVSNVLNRPDKVSPATVARVTSAIDRLGFVRNDAARQLRVGRSRTIGLVVLDTRNPFFTDLAHGAQNRALQEGYSVLLGGSDESSGQEATLLDLFEEQRVAGLLISPVHTDLSRLWRLRDTGTPVVLVDRGSSDRSFSSVSVDDVEGGRLAAQHLVDIGRDRIAFIGGPLNIEQVAQRLEGAQSVVAQRAGVALSVHPTQALSVLEGRRVGEAIAAMPAAERPNAVFAANDLLAMGVIQALVMTSSLRVPEDVALVGYDDIDFARAAVVPITSVRQPSTEIGATAVELLMREADGRTEHEQVVFQPQLITRASTLGHE